MAIKGYHLGCPSWGLKDWVGTLYSKKARAQDYLHEYAQVFNAVEGNTTFYSLPTAQSVNRWRDSTPEGFRFCFKFPRTITHDKGLRDAESETREFLERMAPLGGRLGPFMIQLPPSFGPARIDLLRRYLESLPRDLHYAVELRHRGYYSPETRDTVRRVLHDAGAELTLMDTRPLRSGDPRHPDVMAARRQKPSLPVDPQACGSHPFLRLICHPEDEVNLPWTKTWCRVLAGWIGEGRSPCVFIHCPNDVHSPRIARRLHEQLRRSLEVGALAPWPGEEAEAESGQLRLW